MNLLFHRNNEKQFEMVEERISECEDRSREIIQLEMKKKKYEQKMNRASELWGTINRNNIA